MLFETFIDEGLSQYSYAVGCPEAGELAVIDPRRDIDVYTDFAVAEGLEITDVLETHIHADFASGARELAHQTGAALHLSAYDHGEDYEVAFTHREVRDGDSIELGSVRLEARHTPGHTPEHLCYLVYDLARSEEVPQIILSGDFLFVGSLGRPDLLGEEASQALAGRLFESVREVLSRLPDGLEVRPAHGSGSMCGSGMSDRPLSTLGYERAANPYLDPDLSKDAFVERILGSVPPFPDYYKRMKVLNSEGPPLLSGLPEPRPLSPPAVAELAGGGFTVVDLRDPLSFAAGHISGSLGIGESGNLSEWAAWVVPYDEPILLVPAGEGDEDAVEEAVRAFVRVGLDNVVGLLRGGIDAWITGGLPIKRVDTISSDELARRRRSEDLFVLDVRSDSEWEEGHIQGAKHVMAGELSERLDELPGPKHRVALYCGSGYRSTVAASVLERAGYDRLLNVVGGITAWEAAGHPTV